MNERIINQAEDVLQEHGLKRLRETALAFKMVKNNDQILLPNKLSVMYNYNECLRLCSAGDTEIFETYEYHWDKEQGFWSNQ